MLLLRFGKCCFVFRSCLFVFQSEGVSSLFATGYIRWHALSVHIFSLCVCKHSEDWFIFWNVLSRFLGERGRLTSQRLQVTHTACTLSSAALGFGDCFRGDHGRHHATPHYRTGMLEAQCYCVRAQAWSSCKRLLSIRHVISFTPIIICASPKRFPG